MKETLYSLLEMAARRGGGIAALATPDGAVSRQEFHENILRLANGLDKSLQRPGGIVIHTRDSIALLTAFFACAAIGRPALPLDPDLPAAFIDDLLGSHSIAAVLASDTAFRFAGEIPVLSLSDLPDAAAENPAEPVDPDAEFYWGLTSGTTGAPKLFARSHASWIASFEAAEQVFSFPPQSRILIPGPLHHSLFLYGAVHALCRGHTVLLPGGRFRPNRLASSTTQATHLYAVPFMLGELLKTGAQAPDLHMIFSGGAKLSDELRIECEDKWPRADLVEFYGASETSFVTYHSTSKPAKSGSVGRLFPGVEVEIRDDEGNALPHGDEGRILVRSPMLFSRYVGDGPSGEWFSPGDMGCVDADGCLYLTGRTSRMIKSKGLKIHPEPIEAVLSALPEIRNVAVVDLPDPVRGSVPVAAIEFTGGEIPDRGSVSARCRESLGVQYCPHRYFVTDALPLTGSGKVAIDRIRNALISGDAAYKELL